MANSSQPYSCSTGQTGGECKHPECSLRCSQDLGHCCHHALSPGGSSHGTLSKCDILCHCTTEDFALPVPALQGVLLYSEYIYSLERSKENATSQIFFPLTPFHFLGSSLCFQTHICWSNLQSCLGITLPLNPLVHRFLLPWSSCSCCCLAS